MEADQRHIDIIIGNLNLDESKGDKASCDEEKTLHDEVNSIVLDDDEARKNRELAAKS